MERQDILLAKSRYSMVCVDMPLGSHEYKGFCVLPSDNKYFTSNEEVDEYEQVVLELYMKHGKEAFALPLAT